MKACFEKVGVTPNSSFRVEHHRLAQFDSPWHFHPEAELTLILKSSGRRFVGDSIEPFAEGDLVLLGPNLPHFWRNEEPRPKDERAESLVVQFRDDFLGADLWKSAELARIRRLLDRAGRGLHFTGKTAREVSGELQDLPRRTGLAGLTTLLSLLEKLAGDRRARPLASASYAPLLDRQTEARLARVYSYGASHFRAPVKLADLAGAAAMAPAAFSRYFKRTTGRNPSDFLNDLRVDEVCRLLRESDATVTTIAGEAGFETLTNFNRRFRERTGTTPREYRKNFRESVMPERFVAV